MLETRINTFKIEERFSFPPNENPFCHDGFHMGTYIGKNCCVMYPNHQTDHCHYLIVVNVETGDRIKVSLLNEK